MWIQLYTSVESLKPEVLRDGTIRLFFLSIPMVALLMDNGPLCDTWLITKYFHLRVRTWHVILISNAIAFLQMYKYLILPFASTKYYKLELSPTSMQCTHGAAIKLFCRYRTMVAISPVIGGKVGEWHVSSRLRWRRPWARRPPVTIYIIDS